MAGSRFSDVGLFLHGTTVASHEFWSGRVRGTALVTTKGFSATSTRSGASIGRMPS